MAKDVACLLRMLGSYGLPAHASFSANSRSRPEVLRSGNGNARCKSTLNEYSPPKIDQRVAQIGVAFDHALIGVGQRQQ